MHDISIEPLLRTSDMSSLPLARHNRITQDGQLHPCLYTISQTRSFGEANLLPRTFGLRSQPDAFLAVS